MYDKFLTKQSASAGQALILAVILRYHPKVKKSIQETLQKHPNMQILTVD